MRTKSHQKKEQPEGLLGIRPGVWWMVLGPVALCMMFVLLPAYRSRHSTGFYREEVSARVPVLESYPHSNGQARPRGIRFTPAFHAGDGATEDGMMFMIEQLIEDRRTWVDEPSGRYRLTSPGRR